MIMPCGHRVLVKPDEVEEIQRGVLYIPASAREKQQYAQTFGTIVAIGLTAWKGFDEGEPWAKVGDRVSYAKYGGYLLEDPETKEQFRVLNDEDIVCKISGAYQIREEAV